MILDKLVQLHENVTIIYVVDGYNAILYRRDGYDRVVEAKGQTILEALINLNTECSRMGFKSHIDVRGYIK